MNGRYQNQNFYKNNNSNDIMYKTFYNSNPYKYALNNKTTKPKISFTIKCVGTFRKLSRFNYYRR